TPGEGGLPAPPRRRRSLDCSPFPVGFPSGQRGRAVNPLAQPSQVRILLPPLRVRRFAHPVKGGATPALRAQRRRLAPRALVALAAIHTHTRPRTVFCAGRVSCTVRDRPARSSLNTLVRAWRPALPVMR